MDQQTLDELIDEIIAEEMAIADEVVAELADLLPKIASPEKLIGKPKEEWTLNDIQRMTMIYGGKDKNRLARPIFEAEYAEYQKLMEEQHDIHTETPFLEEQKRLHKGG